jgi:cell division protein DivIC
MNLEIPQKWLRFKLTMFLKKLNKKKFVLFSIFLFIYLSLILFNGERGLISYFEKQKVKKNLIEEQELLLAKLILFEKKNALLSDNLDLDYLETLYRKKFMLGKRNEKIYVN